MHETLGKDLQGFVRPWEDLQDFGKGFTRIHETLGGFTRICKTLGKVLQDQLRVLCISIYLC